MGSTKFLRIFFIEGPAGGGKTSVRDKLINESGLVNFIENPLPIEISRPRAYNTHDSGASLSLIKDFRSLLDILAQDVEGNYLIDRCFISQIIYHAIRTNRAPARILNDAMSLIPRIVRTTQFILNELLERNPEKPQYPSVIDYRIIFVIPENEVELQVRRNMTEKVYPYDAFLENQLYSMFYDFLEPPGMKIRITNWKDYYNKLIPWIQNMKFPTEEQLNESSDPIS